MANKLSEIDWFEWNGVKCTEYGMHALSLPSAIRPSERISTTSIPGRSGSLTVLEGDDIFDDVSLSCTCVIDQPYDTVDGTSVSRIAKISGWLRGLGTVRFPNRPEGYYKARVANQISFDQIVRGDPHRSFSVQFSCTPYFYLTSGDEEQTFTTTGQTITNEGNVPSQPLIKLTGTGEGAIMIGDQTMTISSFDDINYIMLDCEAKVAYQGERDSTSDPLKLLGTRVSGDWIKIPTGTSYVTLTGKITAAVITPRWRRI